MRDGSISRRTGLEGLVSVWNGSEQVVRGQDLNLRAVPSNDDRSIGLCSAGGLLRFARCWTGRGMSRCASPLHCHLQVFMLISYDHLIYGFDAWLNSH